jgi:hypothetical protein
MFPNEARYQFDWTYTSKVSYGDFLRAKQFERSIRFAIDEQTRQIVASNEDLAERGLALQKNTADGVHSGFTVVTQEIHDLRNTLSSGLSEIDGQLGEMNYTLRWGFGAVLGSLSAINATLSTLTRIARTPSATWAYEQFEQARDEFRRNLYEESLASVVRAINGHGSNPGHRTEFRFHLLLGTIRLGDYKNSSEQVVVSVR